MHFDVDISGFQELVEDHSARTGFELPPLLETYLSQLLQDRLGTNMPVEPPCLATCYLDLDQGGWYLGMKTYADQCLFWSSMLPQSQEPDQLTTVYWASMGTAAYHAYAHHAGDDRFHQLAIWFEPLQRFLASMVRQPGLLSLVSTRTLEPAKYSKGLESSHENSRTI